MTDVSPVFDVEQAAEYIGLSKGTVYQMARDGQIPAKKLGKQWRFHKIALDDWLIDQARGNMTNE